METGNGAVLLAPTAVSILAAPPDAATPPGVTVRTSRETRPIRRLRPRLASPYFLVT